jgi:Ca-activated chloride channel family protein
MSQFNNVVAASLAVALLAACAQNATQQAATSPSAGAPASEESAAQAIVVTGSRISRDDYAAASPTVTVDRGFVGRAAPAAPPALLAQATSSRFAPRPEPWPQPSYKNVGRDRFTAVSENPFKAVTADPVSTFSIDVDTASYSFVRASLNQNVLPQPAAVRTEEMVNYFPYNYAAPLSAQQPFSTNVAVFPSPWTALGASSSVSASSGYECSARRDRAPISSSSIDTSGSMNEPNKLPLVKQSLAMLLDQLDGDDSVAIVTYAGYAGTALEPTPASQKAGSAR